LAAFRSSVDAIRLNVRAAIIDLNGLPSLTAESTRINTPRA
jgi:hypothetical protein